MDVGSRSPGATCRQPGPRGIRDPQLIRSGRDDRGDWIVLPFYDGDPAPSETAIPDNVPESLAAVHAQYLNCDPPAAVPSHDADWWRASCRQHRLRQLGHPSLQPVVDAVASWANHSAILAALTELPRTLLHGDVHRNNVLVDGHAGHLIDWGGAAYGLPHVDLVAAGLSFAARNFGDEAALRMFRTASRALTELEHIAS